MEGIEIKGIELLNDAEKNELDKEVTKYSEKIKWKTKSDFVLKLVIKTNSKKYQLLCANCNLIEAIEKGYKKSIWKN